MMRSILAVSLAVAMGGCATTNATSESVVLVNDRNTISTCSSLGQIQTQSLWGGFAATGIAYNDAMAALKNQAAERGANRILLVNVSNTLGGTNIVGDAYRCPK